MRAVYATLIVALTAGCGGATISGETTPKVQTETMAASPSPPAVLVRRTPVSSGALDGDRAGRLLARNTDQLAACYDVAGGERAGRGVVYLLVDVEGSGAVTRLTVGHSDVRSLRFETCLRQELTRLEFPLATGPSTLQAHLVFGAESVEEGREMMRRYRASRAPAPAAPRPSTARHADIRQRIQACYERARRDRPWLRGRMVLELTLDRDGAVSNASITDGGLDRQLSRCVLRAVENLRLEGDHASTSTLQFPVILH